MNGWRLVLLLALSGAAMGGIYGAFGRSAAWVGAAVGASNAAVLSALEIFVLGGFLSRALSRWSFASYLALRVGLYFVLIVGLNLAVLALVGVARPWTGLDLRDVLFALAISALVNLLFSVNDLLGPGVLFAFAAGRYRRPRREERALLYLDLCGSTALAEKLGEERFLDFLNAFFADVTGAIVAQGGEIHKYVGDEVIAVWREAAPDRPVRAALAAQSRLAARAGAYRAEFGAAPSFRVALHAGPVVIGELGAEKKEIALIGDAMNTAARILEAARETGAQALISAAFFARRKATLAGVVATPLPPIPARGKSVPLALIRLETERAPLAGGKPLD